MKFKEARDPVGTWVRIRPYVSPCVSVKVYERDSGS